MSHSHVMVSGTRDRTPSDSSAARENDDEYRSGRRSMPGAMNFQKGPLVVGASASIPSSVHSTSPETTRSNRRGGGETFSLRGPGRDRSPRPARRRPSERA